MSTATIRIYLATGNDHKAEEIGALLRDFGAPCVVLGAQGIGGMPQVDENADSFEGNARLKALALLEQLKAAPNSGGGSAPAAVKDGAVAPPAPANRGATQQQLEAKGSDATRAPLEANGGGSQRTAAVDDAAPHGGQQPVRYVLADDSGLCVAALGGAPGIRSARYAGAGADDAANNALLLQNLAATPADKRHAAFVCCFVLLGTDGTETVFHGRCKGRIAREASGAGGFGYDPLFIPDGYDQSFAELGGAVKNTISHRTRCCEQLAALFHSKAPRGCGRTVS